MLHRSRLCWTAMPCYCRGNLISIHCCQRFKSRKTGEISAKPSIYKLILIILVKGTNPLADMIKFWKNKKVLRQENFYHWTKGGKSVTGIKNRRWHSQRPFLATKDAVFWCGFNWLCHWIRKIQLFKCLKKKEFLNLNFWILRVLDFLWGTGFSNYIRIRILYRLAAKDDFLKCHLPFF